MANRLGGETSPYLRQHADNPVDWYPWGPEAFEAARRDDRPILLSIGYSACHWCHVMEHESFSEPETAALMNERFVNIKVDREERPDVDHVYMTAVQMLTGQGGWPLTVFLTPQREPYFGGTYFPPERRHGMPAFRDVLRAVSDAYRDRRDQVVAQAAELRELVARSAQAPLSSEAEEDDSRWVDQAFAGMRGSFDRVHGGFGGAPKFPQPSLLEALLRRHWRTGEGEALSMVVHTLRAMVRGGIFDQLAGGFHRYSVDARWLVPHFEKMLYDNAQLARVYAQAYRAAGDPLLREGAERTIDYVLADLRAPEGAFFSARDADSEGEEGRYYVWSQAEIDARLGEDAALFRRTYGVSAEGNWEGTNILHVPHDLSAIARSEGLEEPELRGRLARARDRLLEARAEREPPLLDDKVLTDWSALMVRALAETAGLLGRDDYRVAAEEGLGALLTGWTPGSPLGHARHGDRTGAAGFLSDYAALGNAALSVYEATLDPRWLRAAVALAEETLRRFGDSETALLFDTPADGETLIVRPRDLSDGAQPSGNALAAELLLRLGRVLGRDDWTERTGALLRALGPSVARHPLAFGHLLAVAESFLTDPVEIALVPGPNGEVGDLLRGLDGRYLPGWIVAGPGAEGSPILQDRPALPDGAVAYVCRHRTCSLPMKDRAALAAELERVGLPPHRG